MEVPKYIATLLTPSATAPSDRRVWSIPLQGVLVPFFTATNTVKATNIPSEALGAPLRLTRSPDGEVKFSRTGKPVLKVAPEIASQVRVMRENLIANLLSFTGKVATTEKEAYKAEVEAAQRAAAPILAKDEKDLVEAVAAQVAAAETEPAPTDGHRELVTA